jgi:hypothetical protein
MITFLCRLTNSLSDQPPVERWVTEYSRTTPVTVGFDKKFSIVEDDILSTPESIDLKASS